MHTQLGIAVIVIVVSSFAWAEDRNNDGRYGAKPLKGDFYVYGGTLAEMTLPKRKDRKISFMLQGDLAKELFDQIGPDAKVACSSDPGYRERRRGDLDCVYSSEDGYSCYLGLDVTSGKSINGSIC